MYAYASELVTANIHWPSHLFFYGRHSTFVLNKRVKRFLTINFPFLSQDRSIWRRKATSWDSSMFAFWFNPRSDVQRDRNMKINYPVRDYQSFPLSLECRIRPRTYTPGDLQPLIRGGLVWPGTDPFVCFQKSYYHPSFD